MTILRRHRDALLALLLGAVICAELVAWDRAENLPAALGAAAVAGLVLAFRRRAALATFVVCMISLEVTLHFATRFDNDSLGLVLIYYLALWSLGRWTRGLEAWLAVPAVLVMIVDFALSDLAPGDRVPDLGDVAFTLAFVGGPWAAGVVVRLRQERQVFLEEENSRLESEQAEVARRAVAEERSRIARELHDVVSHAISVTVLQARGARWQLGRSDDDVRRALETIEQTNTAALGDMRRLLAVLRDTEEAAADAHAPQPSLANLDALAGQVRAAGLPVEIEVAGPREDVPPGVDLSAYRIVQEALTNVLKHSIGGAALVRLEYAPDHLAVAIENTGEARAGAGTGHGLLGIRERVAVIGGEVEAGPVPGGFSVRARLPYALEMS